MVAMVAKSIELAPHQPFSEPPWWQSLVKAGSAKAIYGF
jgi:hypothetical protein